MLAEAIPYTFFDREVPKPRRDRIFTFYRRLIERHLHAHPEAGRQYLAKNPALSPKLETVFEHFPDARVVYLARNPLEMLPSYVSMMRFSWQAVGMPTHGRHGEALNEYLLEMAGYWYRHPLAVLDRLPAERGVVVRYDELTADPEAQVRRIYDQWGWEVDPGFARVLAEETERARSYESRHEYSLEEVGLDRQRVLSDFADVFARFGFTTG